MTNPIEYRIEQEFRGEWFGLDTGLDKEQIKEQLRALREYHPDRIYQLVMLEVIRKVIG